MNKYNKRWQHLYDARWTSTAIIFLKQNPLCVYCLEVGNTAESEVVDHIKPHKGNRKLFWDRTNWQPLCKYCHDSVKAIEEARGYRVGCDVNGMPVGVHPWNEE